MGMIRKGFHVDTHSLEMGSTGEGEVKPLKVESCHRSKIWPSKVPSVKRLGRLWAIVAKHSCETRQFSVGWPKGWTWGTAQLSLAPPTHQSSLGRRAARSKDSGCGLPAQRAGPLASGTCPAGLAFRDSAEGVGRIFWK